MLRLLKENTINRVVLNNRSFSVLKTKKFKKKELAQSVSAEGHFLAHRWGIS